MKKTKKELLARKAELARIRYNLPNSKQKQKQKEYRINNIKAYNIYRNNYRTKNARGIYDVLKAGAKKRNIIVGISRDDFALWYNSQKRECIYCKRSESDILLTDSVIQTKCNRLTIDRLNNDMGYCNDNLGLCCKRCNIIKGNFFTESEMMEIGLIIKNKLKC